MSERISERWLRWDILINKKKYKEVVDEYDEMKKKGIIRVFGDLIRRNQSLELMGVIPINTYSLQKRNNEKYKR